ncbi:hypothetical protein GIB67_025074, partial [Kingdonia uniflora]
GKCHWMRRGYYSTTQGSRISLIHSLLMVGVAFYGPRYLVTLDWFSYFCASLRNVRGTGENTSFQVSIDGLELQICWADIQKAFGLVEVYVLVVVPTEWPPIPDQFPSNREMKNILPQLGNKNVLVGNMIYLVYLYSMAYSIGLALPFSKFFSQLLTVLGYSIHEDEVADHRDKVIAYKYYKKSIKHMGAESELEEGSKDSETKAEPTAAGQAAASRSPTTTVLAAYAGSAPQDIASLYTYMESQFGQMNS